MSLPHTQPVVPKLAEARRLTRWDHIVNTFRLVIKELRSIRSDPMMLILVAYAFTISVHTVATGALTEATNLSVGIADEDGSELSRQIAEGLVRPTFQPAVQIRASDIDAKMDRGELLFVVEIPPTFQANVVAQRQTEIQINVDATAVAQAGNGATYLKTAISNEMQHFMNARGIASGSPINLVLRTDFNPNLNTAWFSAMTQVINQITTLTVILTGVALIREREQGTVEHLLVMPVVPAEIMLAKMFANGPRHPRGGDAVAAIRRSLVDRRTDRRLALSLPPRHSPLCARGCGSRHPARHAVDDHRPIWAVGDAGPRRHPIAVRHRHADGEHAGLAAIRDASNQPDAALRVVRSSRALPRRRYHSGLGPTGRHARHRFGLFPFRDEPLPSRHFRKLTPLDGVIGRRACR